MLKFWNHSISIRNYAVNYYETQYEVTWHLGLTDFEKLANIFKKLYKVCEY